MMTRREFLEATTLAVVPTTCVAAACVAGATDPTDEARRLLRDWRLARAEADRLNARNVELLDAGADDETLEGLTPLLDAVVDELIRTENRLCEIAADALGRPGILMIDGHLFSPDALQVDCHVPPASVLVLGQVKGGAAC